MRTITLRFDYKEQSFDKEYLLEFWIYLYYINPSSMNRLVKKKKVSKKIQKIGWLTKFFFKRSDVYLTELIYVKESLEKFSLNDLRVIQYYINMVKIESNPFDELKFSF